MKNQIIVFISILLMAYLIGSFISVSFNIKYWFIELRFVCAVAGVFFGIATIIIREIKYFNH